MAAKRILVVEDNLDNRRILVYRLKRIGEFDIVEASNGEEALAIVQALPAAGPHLHGPEDAGHGRLGGDEEDPAARSSGATFRSSR